MNFQFIILSIYLLIIEIKCNNIFGCGGFIKTDIKGFEYKRLTALLTFVEGTVNYVTDILPNGAYSVPIYDLGSYVIKIVGPEGWNIEPVGGYQLLISGQETCSVDYNFQFVGFTIYGKVSTANINIGPAGIYIDLLNKTKVISQTTTIVGGSFEISKVMPGNYTLHFKSETVDGKSIELNDTSFNFQVKNDNVNLTESFIIHGYPVLGDIKFYEEPMKDVEFYVLSKSLNNISFNFSKYKCLHFDSNFLNIEGYKALCKTISNVNGEFIFPLLPGGKYLMVPIYQSNITVYDIHPNKLEFEITSSSIDLRSVFQITGFSVVGRIITFNGSPISNAEVHVNGNMLSKSDSNGNFTLKGMKRGIHEILIKLEGYLFKKTEINFTPKTPFIVAISPEKLAICGSIIIGNFKSADQEANELLFRKKILLINESDGEIVDFVYTQMHNVDDLKTPGNNNIVSNFCFYSTPGSYVVKPYNNPAISSFNLSPNEIKVLLTSFPITVKFSPFRGTISGIVKCIEHCNTGEFEVTLKATDEAKDSVQFTQHISISTELINHGYFQFKDIVPGNYQIELISANSLLPLDKNRWCWSETTLAIHVIDKNIDGLLFEQRGFSLPIDSSHDLKMEYIHQNSPDQFVGSQSLTKGLSKVCLPISGKYEVKIKTCHKLTNTLFVIDLNQHCEKQFDFRNPKCHLKIDVTEFKVRVRFELIGQTDNNQFEELKSHVKGVVKTDSDVDYRDIIWIKGNGYFEFWVEPDRHVQVSVNSTKYLVAPENMIFQLTRDTVDCLTELGTFQLEAGTFITGKISSALQGVEVKVRRQVSPSDEEDIEPIVAFAETDENGRFNLGPLNSTYQYSLKLSKSGYKIVQGEHVANHYNFNAYKLAELIVEVIDNFTGKPLSGILLSIIGDDLRKNELTNEQGKFVFVGLSPGTYYLRAMMKELEFFPHGAVEVLVVEGNVEKIVIRATRTAFSLHGKVVSLNGEAEGGVIIEADFVKDSINQVNCRTNLVRSEHATTDEFGAFRIRGLQPGCYYRLSLKNININEDNAIIRSYPNNMSVKMKNEDVHNVKIYAVRNINLKELSAMIWTDEEDYLTSLHLLVFPSDNPDNVFATHKFMSSGIYFQTSFPQTHKRMEYVIRLQSNLNPNMYTNISAQEQILVVEADDTRSVHKHFNFHFHPIKKSVADSDIAITLTSSLILPFFIVLLSAIFFKRDSLEPLTIKIFNLFKTFFCRAFKYSNLNATSSATKQSNNLDPMELSELNNAIARLKPIPVLQQPKKVPFWSRPKKV